MAYKDLTPLQKLEAVETANAGALDRAACIALMLERGEITEAEAAELNAPAGAPEGTPAP